MDNNVVFISSIKQEQDFEELVRRFVQKVFDAHAYLVGGPYDGGRDLVYVIRNKEVRQAMQISIQEKSLESKLDDDLRKVVNLVDNHGYPSAFYFFWSHTLSASREDAIKTDARKKYGIAVEIYDAKKMAQKITNDYSDILRYLLEDIHGYTPSSNADFDIKERALYEYLTLSKETTNLKNVIVESQIVSVLHGNNMKIESLIEYLIGLGVPKGKASAVISDLKKKNRITEESGEIGLSVAEIDRVINIATKDAARKLEVLTAIKNITEKYTPCDISSQILDLIKKAYAASVDIQISEINFEPPKLSLIKKAAEDIQRLLTTTAALKEAAAIAVTHELLSQAAENDYLSNYCSSRLCIGLLNQKKLERYIHSKYFFIYLDAPVLIRVLILLRFSRNTDLDEALRIVNVMRASIHDLRNKRIRATREHFEETIRHLENALRISRFASDTLIAEIGDSKNIFFNAYLNRKKTQKKTYSFPKFLEELIGYEQATDDAHISFADLLRCAEHFLKLSGIEVITGDFDIDDSTTSGLVQKFRVSFGKQRKSQTIKNDLIACQVLSDDRFHLDENGVGQTPMLITWDSTQHEMRNFIRQKFNRHGEWLIYTPQRAIERLSMVDLVIQSKALKDGVLAIIDEDFFKDSKNSLLDTLGLFLGEDQVETGAVISLITKLSRRITDEAKDDAHRAELDGYNTLNEVLIYTQYEFKPDIKWVRQLFSDQKFSKEVIDLLRTASATVFDDKAKESYSIQLRDLIDKSQNSIVVPK